MSLSKLQRIKIVMNYYYKKGYNSERVNEVYRKIISKCKICGLQNGNHKMSCYFNKAKKGL
jgi:hypothetical protein